MQAAGGEAAEARADGSEAWRGPMAATRGTSWKKRELKLERWARADSEGPCMRTEELSLDPAGQCSPN